MRNGYTLLFMGWQFDPPSGNGRIRVYPPTASINGKPIRGLVRADFIVTDRVRHHILVRPQSHSLRGWPTRRRKEMS